MQIILEDFDKWKQSNKDFTLFDYVFQEARNVNLNSDFYFAFFELIWPKFIRRNEFVFLEQNYSSEKLQKLHDTDAVKKDHQNIEFWMNLVNIDPFFEHTDVSDEHVEAFTIKLVETWSAKLKIDFPNVSFKVEYMHDADVSDYALTFYQTNNLK
jgi:hypothetical protein